MQASVSRPGVVGKLQFAEVAPPAASKIASFSFGVSRRPSRSPARSSDRAWAAARAGCDRPCRASSARLAMACTFCTPWAWCVTPIVQLKTTFFAAAYVSAIVDLAGLRRRTCSVNFTPREVERMLQRSLQFGPARRSARFARNALVVTAPRLVDPFGDAGRATPGRRRCAAARRGWRSSCRTAGYARRWARGS